MSTAKPDIVTLEQWRAARAKRCSGRRRPTPARVTPWRPSAAGCPVEEALLAAPALLAGVTMIAGYARATARRGPRQQETPK